MKHETNSILIDLIETVKENLEELSNEKDEVSYGQKIAYVEILDVLRDMLPLDYEKFGLNENFERKYLF